MISPNTANVVVADRHYCLSAGPEFAAVPISSTYLAAASASCTATCVRNITMQDYAQSRQNS
eukprot:7462841-Alexandrium_andersonii.AAC.1